MKKRKQNESGAMNKKEKTSPRPRVFLWTGVIFILLSLIWWRTDSWYKEQTLKKAKSDVQRELTLYGYFLTTEIHKYFAMIDGLAAFVDSQIASGKNISAVEFNLFAKGFIKTPT